MRPEVRNRVTMLKDAVAAEIPPSRSGRRAWLMITPTEEGRVMLVEFEHHSDLDTDAFPAPEDILDRKRTDYGTIDDAITALKYRGIDTDLFDAPWKMDYPL